MNTRTTKATSCLSVHRPFADQQPVRQDPMTSMLTFLISLGLSLGSRNMAKAEISTPIIWAEPGSIVTWGTPVTIWCQGTFGALEYHLDKKGSPPNWDRQTPLEPGKKANFSILSMTEHHAGRYCCYYRSPAGLSECSDPLELVVTGVYRKPTLTVLSNSVVAAGGNMTIQCGSQLAFSKFILSKEGEHPQSRTLNAQLVRTGQMQALFLVSALSSTQRWTFRCYGSYQNKTHVWSESSDPLKLLLSESQPQDHTLENLIRMAIAGIVLLILGILLFEAWHSQRRTQHAAMRLQRRETHSFGSQAHTQVGNIYVQHDAVTRI